MLCKNIRRLIHYSGKSKTTAMGTNQNIMGIKTFVFLDLETTGLPSLENNRTKITELCMIAVQSNHLCLGIIPRVQNKISLCFNPWKLISFDAEKITGLSNHLLEYQSKFSADTVNIINNFLNHNPKPICFVAHNGNKFDFPILQKEIQSTGYNLIDDILCIDSLDTFRDLHIEEIKNESITSETDSCVPLEFFDEYDKILCDAVDKTENTLSQKVYDMKKLNETTPKKQIISDSPTPAKICKTQTGLHFGASFKLSDIYSRVTNQVPTNQHHAEGDVNMLLACGGKLGSKFIDWANANAKKFCDISPMVPGKPIGHGYLSKIPSLIVTSCWNSCECNKLQADTLGGPLSFSRYFNNVC